MTLWKKILAHQNHKTRKKTKTNKRWVQKLTSTIAPAASDKVGEILSKSCLKKVFHKKNVYILKWWLILHSLIDQGKKKTVFSFRSYIQYPNNSTRKKRRHTGKAFHEVLVEWWTLKGGNPQCWVDQDPIQNLKTWVSLSYSSKLWNHFFQWLLSKG